MTTRFSYSGTSPATVYSCVRDPDAAGLSISKKWMSPMIESAAGVRFVYDKAIVKNIMTLTWSHIDTGDLAGILSFLAVVGYGANAFDFTDPAGGYWTAQFLGPDKLTWVETDVDNRSFMIELLVTAKTVTVTNGGFDSDASGWTAANATLASMAGGDSGNCLRLTSTGGDEQDATQEVSGLTIGAVYKLSVKAKEGSVAEMVFGLYAIKVGAGIATQYVYGTASGSWVGHDLYFTAEAETMVIGLGAFLVATETIFFDTVTLSVAA